MAADKKFTRDQVSKHDSKSEAVFIINNVVYDVTQFLDEHPGGHEVLVNEVGRDATEAWEDVGHSMDAKELMKKYVIGEVVEEERVDRQKRTPTWEETKVDNETSFMISWKFPVVLGIVVTVLYSYLFG